MASGRENSHRKDGRRRQERLSVSIIFAAIIVTGEIGSGQGETKFILLPSEFPEIYFHFQPNAREQRRSRS